MMLVAMLAIAAVLGALLGWLARGDRAAREKLAINAEWHERAETLEARLAESAERAQTLERALASLRDRLRLQRASAGAERQRLERAAAELVARLEAGNLKRDRLRRELERLIVRSRHTAAVARDKDEKICALGRELEHWRRRLPPLVERFRSKDLEVTAVREALAFERARAEALAAGGQDSGPAENLAVETEQRLEEELAALRRALEKSAAECRRLEEALARAERRAARRDDLKRIKGVGPALERKLNELGIFRFDQLAALDDDGIERIARSLEEFPNRIHRDRWVDQARDLSRPAERA